MRDRLDPASWRPVPDGDLHLTLAFLGSRPEEDVEEGAAAVRAAAGPAPALLLGAPVLLPPRRPRVLALAVHDRDGELAALQARVSAGLTAAGLLTPEARPFRPHVTLARVRPRVRPSTEVPEPGAAAPFAAPAVTLYASRLHPSGARYEPLARVPLG